LFECLQGDQNNVSTTPVDELASALIDKLNNVKFAPKIAYTIKELADAMGVGEGTIVGLRERGELKGKLVGKQILFHRAEVDKFFGVRS
jgi:excisionase family DNA binding protein